MSVFMQRMGLIGSRQSAEEAPPWPTYSFYELDVTANNGGAYMSCQEFEMFDAEDIDQLIGTARTGVADASSTNAFTGAAVGLYEAEGFDPGSTGAGWVTASGSTGWSEWFDDTAFEAVSVVLSCRDSDAARMVKDFTIQHSDDGDAWTTALTVTDETGWSPHEYRKYDWAADGEHRYWKIDVTANNGDAFLGIESLRYITSAGEVITASLRKAVIHANNHFSSTNLARYMLDNVGGWTSAIGSTNKLYIQTAKPTAVTRFVWTPRPSEDDRCPTNFTVKGSNDGVSWDTLLRVSGETSWAGSPISFDLERDQVYPPSYSNFSNVKFLSALDIHPWVDESDVGRGSTYIGAPVVDGTKTIFGQSMTSYDGDDDGSLGTVDRTDCFSAQGPFWVGCYIRIPDDQLTDTVGMALINFREQNSLHWGMTLGGLKLGFNVWQNNGGTQRFLSATDSDVFEAGKTYLVGVGRIATGGNWKFWVGEVGVDSQCTVRKTIVDSGNMSDTVGSVIRIGFSTFGGNGSFLKGHMGEAIVIFDEPFVTGDFDMPTVPWDRS